MPTYRYKAYNRNGRASFGRIEARNGSEAEAELTGRGLLVEDLHEETTAASLGSESSRRVKPPAVKLKRRPPVEKPSAPAPDSAPRAAQVPKVQKPAPRAPGPSPAVRARRSLAGLSRCIPAPAQARPVVLTLLVSGCLLLILSQVLMARSAPRASADGLQKVQVVVRGRLALPQGARLDGTPDLVLAFPEIPARVQVRKEDLEIDREGGFEAKVEFRSVRPPRYLTLAFRHAGTAGPPSRKYALTGSPLSCTAKDPLQVPESAASPQTTRSLSSPW